MTELFELLQKYLKSSKNLRDCAEWLAGVDWDDPELTNEERESLGLFELLSTEVAEHLRDEREFRDAAIDFIAGTKAKNSAKAPLR